MPMAVVWRQRFEVTMNEELFCKSGEHVIAGSACSGGLAAGLHHDRPCAKPERDPESGMAAAPCFWKFPATQQSTPNRSLCMLGHFRLQCKTRRINCLS